MVKKYKTFLKLQWRMVSKTKSRFISILVITLIGSAFFAGLRITPTVMNTTTDKYLDQQNYADLTLIPTYGINNQDIEELEKIDGIEKVEGIYFFDAKLERGKDEDGMVIYSYSEYFNQPKLVSGRYIENELECLVDEQYQLNTGLNLGDKITLSNDNGTKEFEIVGFTKDVRQILYHKRGTNQYGNGSTQGFIIIDHDDAKSLALNQDLIDLLGSDDFYNEALIKVYDVDEMIVFNKDYDDYLNRVEADIEELMSIRLSLTYEELIADKKELLAEPLKEYEDGLAAYKAGQLEFERSITEAEMTLIEGRIQVLEGRKQLVEAQSEFTGNADIDGIVGGLQTNLEDLQSQLTDLKEQINNSTEQPLLPNVEEETPKIDFPELPNDPFDNNTIIETIDLINESIGNLNESLGQLSEMANGMLQLQSAQLALDKAEIELDMGEQTLLAKKEEGKKELDEVKVKLDEAKIQLDEAQAQIDLIPKGEYYLLDQNMNEGLVSFKSDSDRIGVIAESFPFMFFLVAALVCLTTMTRMVEEQRSQSGTLRALGYSRIMIIMQYVVYATIPTLIGSIVGFYIGGLIFPYVIYSLYTLMMYDVPLTMIYCIDSNLMMQSISIAVLVTLTATLFSCVREMINVPAILMRPKAPKLGKRIFLERINWLWKRLNFNQKVTMRNIFRYKKRFFMSVIGIAGCSGLILTGYGIKYSVTDMSVYQYGELTLYDGSVSYKQDYAFDDTTSLRDDLKKNDEITEVLFTTQANIVTQNANQKTLDTTLYVPSSASKIDRFIVLRDYKTKDLLTLDDDGAIITQKMSEMLEVEVGDSLQIVYEGYTYDIVISNINENYIGHIVYLSPEYAEAVFGEELKINGASFNIDETNEELEDKIGKNLMKLENVASVSFVSQAGGTVVTQLESVGIVTWLLIGSAGLLAFVVLYNLTNININERITEIATIKVLGFRDAEVNDYVFRENIMLSVIGTIVGLIFGVFLHRSIMLTVEVDLIMFVRQIKPISYLYAISLTMIFTLLINRYMRKVLRKVDMVSSLKSVE